MAPQFQYRTKQHGLLAQFDFGAIADVTAPSLPGAVRAVEAHAHPLRAAARRIRTSSCEFDSRGAGRRRRIARGVEVTIERDGRTETRTGRWLIGADGARSDVRRSLGIEFEGFTWPDRFLVVSTPFDFHSVIPDLAAVSYVADPQRWHFLLQIPGLWRVMFPVTEDESDERALTPRVRAVADGRRRARASRTTRSRTPRSTRCISGWRRRSGCGRAFLVGDAAHINNPLGGMGMNGGIHDAINLTDAARRGLARPTRPRPSSTATTSSAGW